MKKEEANKFNERLDKSFEISNKSVIEWECKSCNKKNRKVAKNMMILANLSLTSCYDCGTINALDLKTKEVIQ